MDIVNRISLKLDNFEKCEFICDFDCSLGQLYDYSCVLQQFIVNKIKEAEAVKKNADNTTEDHKNG